MMMKRNLSCLNQEEPKAWVKVLIKIFNTETDKC